MAKVYDIGLDSDLDLDIQNGDIVIKESTYQHTEHILLANKGHFKNVPQIGVNIKAFLNGIKDSELKRKIRLNLEIDGQTVDNISFLGNELIVKSEYE